MKALDFQVLIIMTLMTVLPYGLLNQTGIYKQYKPPSIPYSLSFLACVIMHAVAFPKEAIPRQDRNTVSVQSVFVLFFKPRWELILRLKCYCLGLNVCPPTRRSAMTCLQSENSRGVQSLGWPLTTNKHL